MPAQATTASRAWPHRAGREQELPAERPRCRRILPLQRARQRRMAIAPRQVPLVQGQAPQCQAVHRIPHAPGKDRHPILRALAGPHGDRARAEIHVLHPQRQRLADAHARAIEQRRHQPRHPVHRIEDRPHLLHRQHHRHPRRSPHRAQALQPTHLATQYLPEQEQHAVQGLQMRTRRHPLHRGQMVEEAHHPGRLQRLPAEEVHEPPGPISVGRLRAPAQVPSPTRQSHLLQHLIPRSSFRRLATPSPSHLRAVKDTSLRRSRRLSDPADCAPRWDRG